MESSKRQNWSDFCGHGEDIESWIGKDFGHCFEQVAILAPAHVLLAIVSVYHFGRRRTSLRGSSLYVSWTWFLVLRFLAVLLLIISPLAQVIFSITVEHVLPSIADGVVVGLSFFAWVFHALYVWNVRYLHSDSLRGPLSALLSFLGIVISCAIHVHTSIIRHISHSVHQSPTEEYTTYINAALCLTYLITIIPNKHRIYHTNIAFQINETEEESEPLTWDRIRSYNSISPTSRNLSIVAESDVGCLSWLTFHWVQRLMSRGAELKISNVDDLYLLPRRLNTNYVDSFFEKVLQRLHGGGNYRRLKTTTTNDLGNCADLPDVQVRQSNNVPSSGSLSENYQSFSANESDRLYENSETESEPDISHHSSYQCDASQEKVSLSRALSSAFGVEYFSLGILKLLADCFGFAGPILLNYLVSFIEKKSDPIYEGYLFAGGLALSTLLGTICSTQFDYNIQVVAYKIRCALVTTIYRKSLTINGVAQAKFTTGEIINYMSTDTDRILNFCPSFHAFWSLPFQVGVSLFLLYQQVGLAFLAGVAFAVLLVPINRWIAGKIGQLSEEMMQYKDERVKLMNELLYGIRVIKFYSWEQHFTDRINETRDKELQRLKGRKYLDALCVYFWATTPVLISILTFTTYVLMGNKLTAAKVFTSLSLFLMLISPLNAFPWVINGLVEAWVSLTRVQKFVCLRDSDLHQYYSDEAHGFDTVIDIKDASFTWMEGNGSRGRFDNRRRSSSSIEEASSEEEGSTSQDSCASIAQTPSQDLEDICFRVEKGQFVGVVGKVGSGKSSLLSAIIGEMNKKQGQIMVEGLDEGFALVSQEPWVQHATVRDNILFGQPFDRARYDLVLESCALVEDLKIMLAGDMTEIGENGITLSGGQRARVALARAVYQNKSVYLLDDPLSAVDAHVAKHIYTHCIMGLLAEKTRVLCTHHTKFLRRADLVVVMEDGRVTQSGPASEVLPHIHIVEERQNDQHSSKNRDNDRVEEEDKEDTLMQEEERQKGVVKATVYKTYWKAVGMCLSPLVLITLFLMQASRNTNDWWLSYWISHSHEKNTEEMTYLLDLWLRRIIPFTNLTSAEDNLRFYLGIYGGLAGANSLFTLMRAFLFAYGGICAATVIHKRLLSAILKAPITFFDTTPVGRIVNRFSSDLYAVDDSLPFILNIFLAQAYGILGTLVITCYGLPWFAICLVPMGAVYYKIQHYYRHTSRELKRLSSVTLSPIYAHFSETIIGLATIRAMRHTQRFCEENKLRLDISQRAQYATQLSARWLDFRLRMLGVAMVTCLSLIAVIQHQVSSVDAGLVGLAISYSLSVTNLLGGVVMFFTETEKEFVSVERCQHYIAETPTEKWEGALFPPSLWPTEGVVEFDCVSLQYRENLTCALDGVSFKTHPGEKIGIVGRTGAGKSSLFLALFRMVEVNRGRILVDNVDISHLDLADVRSRFAVIPQDPFLFSGSVRMNLDPTNIHPDTDLWSVLDRCHLRSCVDRMGGLDAVVSQKGKEFSVGQRQLICLARAMLTKAKILCIDEATASVDMETDSLIQNTIRQEFRESTVLTIAHRMNTVLDRQRVLVMREGTLAEFGLPADLLQNSASLFYHLVYGSG